MIINHGTTIDPVWRAWDRKTRARGKTYPHSSTRQRERGERQGLHMAPGLASGQEIIQRARGR